MSFELVENPAYAGRTPTALVAECHDRTPFITVQCSCGGAMHLHESQTKAIPADAEIAAVQKLRRHARFQARLLR